MLVTSVSTYACCWDTGAINEPVAISPAQPSGTLQLDSVVAPDPELGGKPRWMEA